MSENTPGAKGAVETKTKIMSLAAFVLSTLALSWISSVDSDMIKSLPDWLETVAYSALGAGALFFTGYQTKHKPGKLSLSALRAARDSRVNL